MGSDIEVTPDLIDALGRLGPALPWLLGFVFMVLARKEVFGFLSVMRSDNVANANLGRIAATLDRLVELSAAAKEVADQQNERFAENMQMFQTTNGALASMGTLFTEILAVLRAILAALTAGGRR